MMQSENLPRSPEMLRQLLERERFGPFDRRFIEAVVCAHPWAWPRAASPELAEALEARGFTAPAAPGVGEALLLAYLPQTRRGSLWRLRGQAAQATRLARGAAQTWRDAAAAVPRSVPVLTASIEGIGRRLPEVVCLDDDTQLLDGRSLGLSFCLAIASRAFGVRAARDLAASAAITPEGGVEAVDGLAEKLARVGQRAPAIGRVLVAREQLEEALGVAPDHLKLLGVGSVAEGLVQAFPDLGERLVEQARSATERAQLADRLFELALHGRSATVRWAPIERAASLVARAAEGAGDEARVVHQARFAEAVAARHDGREDGGARALPLPSSGWFGLYPPGVRRQIVAHTIQQCADTGWPDVAETRTLAEAWLSQRRGTNAELDDLRVMGAYGRLLLVHGEPEGARYWQDEALEGWRAYRVWAEMSHPLCVLYLLAGAMGDAARFTQTREEDEAVRSREGFSAASLVYLDLARARAQLQLGLEPDAARATLRRLAEDRNLARHIGCSALRWLARVDEPGAASRLRARVEEDDEHDRDFLVLARLDAARAANDQARVAQALCGLDAVQHTGLIRRMLAHAPPDAPPACYVADFYPY